MLFALIKDGQKLVKINAFLDVVLNLCSSCETDIFQHQSSGEMCLSPMGEVSVLFPCFLSFFEYSSFSFVIFALLLLFLR